jgi:nitronate monooxygenase
LKQSASFASQFGLKFPLVQGPFGGGLSSVELLATVSNLGGLGSFGSHYQTPEQISDLISEIRQKTNSPFAINLWVSDADPELAGFTRNDFEKHLLKLAPYFDQLKLSKPGFPERFGQKFIEQVEVVLEKKPPVFSFVFGVPEEAILKECRKRGIATIGTATTVQEAVLLEQAGVDAVVASGFEAGGHRGSFLKSAEASLTGTFALVPQIRDAVQIPVIAAGGISDVRGVRAAFALGAQAVQVGTAFLATDESKAPLGHKERLRSKGQAGPTTLTRAFTGRLARGLENEWVQDFENRKMDIAPYPAQTWITSKLKAAAIEQGRWEWMALWASQAYPLVRHSKAEQVFADLVRGFAPEVPNLTQR